MLLVRVHFIPNTAICLRGLAGSSRIRKTGRAQGIQARKHSQSCSPVPPPQPTETTSLSSGLNHQLHPSGRPPLNPKARTVSAGFEIPVEAGSTVAEHSSVTGGYRTPLRMSASNTPTNTRNSVKVVYEGPMRRTVRGLKAFSMSSLMLSTAITPFILTMESSVPMVARVSMISAALGASLLSTGLIHYFLSPYVAKATYMSLSHQLNLQNYTIFARRRNNVVNVDDLRRIEGEGFRMIANLKSDTDGKVWYIHPEPDVSGKFWETLDSPRGGYKVMTGKSMKFKEKIGDSPDARMFEGSVENKVETQG